MKMLSENIIRQAINESIEEFLVNEGFKDWLNVDNIMDVGRAFFGEPGSQKYKGVYACQMYAKKINEGFNEMQRILEQNNVKNLIDIRTISNYLQQLMSFVQNKSSCNYFEVFDYIEKTHQSIRNQINKGIKDGSLQLMQNSLKAINKLWANLDANIESLKQVVYRRMGVETKAENGHTKDYLDACREIIAKTPNESKGNMEFYLLGNLYDTMIRHNKVTYMDVIHWYKEIYPNDKNVINNVDAQKAKYKDIISTFHDMIQYPYNFEHEDKADFLKQIQEMGDYK